MRTPTALRISRVARGLVAALSLPLGIVACDSGFSTARDAPPRGTLGRELFTIVCDRVGAQSLREDVTGISFHGVCHPSATGKYDPKVDVSLLPPLQPSTNVDGRPVTVAQQQANRDHFVARVEELGRRREDLIAALDAAIPDSKLAKTAPANLCADSLPETDAGAADLTLQRALSDTMAHLIDLYTDETIPEVTRGLGGMMNDIKSAPDVQAVLARFDARQGYRPMPIALGIARPALAYPRFVPFAQSLLSLLVADGTTSHVDGGAPGAKPEAAQDFDNALAVAYQELRTPDASPAVSPLIAIPDPVLGRPVLSRPRTMLDAVREALLTTNAAFLTGNPALVARRDSRGYVRVSAPTGVVPPPFVDNAGPSGQGDGYADVDDLGQFVTVDGSHPPSPFFAVSANDGPRDSLGRATQGASGPPIYDYIDTRQTFLGAMLRDIEGFFSTDPSSRNEAAMSLLAGLPVLSGGRDGSPSTSKTYPPDPNQATNWALAHDQPAPANLGTSPVSLTYSSFHPDSSPIASLTYAFGQVAGRPELDDMLSLIATLSAKNQPALASFVGMMLEMKAIADKHPEASLGGTATFWDDLLPVLATMAHTPGLLEDVLRALMDPKTLGMEPALAIYLDHKDDVSYDTNNLNGPSINLTDNVTPADFITLVDRTKADSGTNKSELQKFLSLLHDTNGLSICTKDNATVPISVSLGAAGSFNFTYPSDTAISTIVCGIVGGAAPPKLNKCDVFGYQNVMSLLLDVILGQAQLTVRDSCLNKLLNSPLPAIVGGADAFLQQISGVQGFSLHPNLRGFARLLYFNTPYPGLPSDTTPANKITATFLADTITPIESMVCNPSPFTAADGTVFPLRSCNGVGDFLRARDPDALFPVDDLNFVPSLQPIAQAFKTHMQPLLFATLLDQIHLHYGSNQQSKVECDPSQARTNGRWCSQDGLVTYEPMLVDMLNNGVFGRVASFLTTLSSIKVPHCNTFDPTTHLCTGSTTNDGIHVLAEVANLFLDPERSPGLTDFGGSPQFLRNDGVRTAPVAPLNLLIDGFNGIDAAFAAWTSSHSQEKPTRQAGWKAARSSFTDTFLAVDGKADQARFHNQTLIAILPEIMGLLRAQVAVHCPDPTVPCAWGKVDLESELSTTMSGPTYAALVDLGDAIRRDDTARTELEQLITYLIDAASENDAQGDSLAAAVDILQLLQDDTNLQPFERVLANAVAPSVVKADGTIVKRSLADAALNTLSKIFAQTTEGSGKATCTSERDPNGAIQVVLKNMVTPMGAHAETPVEVIMGVIGDVNRADPTSTAKFAAADYANIANEMSEFCLDPSRGLEQFYAVIKQATGN